jgi:glucose-6-phosphate 1-dehydrogenase
MNHRAKNQNQDLKAFAESRVPDLGIPPQACVIDKPIDPCTIVIFGASGDLTARKLIPSLYNLYLNGGLPIPFAVVGCSRTHWSREAFQERMKGGVEEAGTLDTAKWDDFAASLHYQSVEYDSLPSYAALAAGLRTIDEMHQTQGNRVFYLALPPTLYRRVGEMLGWAGLSLEGTEGHGWSRIVIEKPFGRDLKTAIDLDQSLHRSFQEHQIYRIDHYLAKETVQNVLVFRFANAIFEPLWNRFYIDHVKITAAESLGVEHRAGYYEQAGVLRDMFQSHMMQLLATIAMEPPTVFEADRVRDERAKVFRALRPFDVATIEENLMLGQYGPGAVGGIRVPGYRQEPGVNPDSVTPTFALMHVYLDNWRWQGVPFYLMSGKRLARKLTEIIIQFKDVPHSMFRHVLGEHIMANRLILGIQPEERITCTFQTKNPGATFCLRSVIMDFDYHQNYRGPRLDAYEKSLLDCMQGDHMLFWRQDGVELCWSFLTPILEACDGCPEPARRLRFYESGSWGPLTLEDERRFFTSRTRH